ncbi:MAG: hypothetical protein HC769_19150 [Cyanobacteria bacterium CRU_2_1]|nr:hypothetical protein [Cyanobacteria bacterium RU_5_0]NJR60753.1 hypothetical protein [Cyanobacteria bacterium CRU_2_1]
MYSSQPKKIDHYRHSHYLTEFHQQYRRVHRRRAMLVERRVLKITVSIAAISLLGLGLCLGLVQQVVSWEAEHKSDARPTDQSVILNEPPPGLQTQVNELFATLDSRGTIAIGVAEGTRTPNGDRTFPWEQHSDPGNGAVNRGTFSWQFEASSPEEADQKALNWIRHEIIPYLLQEAHREGITLDAETVVQGIDLWTQAPKAGADFIKNLKRCQRQSQSGVDGVLCARVESFVDPATGALQAAGFKNELGWLMDNQIQRINAIQHTLQLSEQPSGLAESR